MRERFFVRRARRLSSIICTRGDFAAPAASDFLDGQKVTKEPLGGGRNRRFGKASRLHAARPLEPPLRGVIPWDGQKISGAQNLSGFPQFFPAHWGLAFQKLRLVRLHRRA